MIIYDSTLRDLFGLVFFLVGVYLIFWQITKLAELLRDMMDLLHRDIHGVERRLDRIEYTLGIGHSLPEDQLVDDEGILAADQYKEMNDGPV